MSDGVRGRVPMLEVNPHVMCVLCGGYFIDATTIIECLHSFCRKCIVTYLESSRFCPICDVQVHKTKPLLSIRPDATLQDIVYKLVPGLYRDEMRRRREFYAARSPSELPCERGEARGEERRAVFAPDELVEVRLQYCPRGTGAPGGTGGTALHTTPQCRYLRCPAVVTVAHLQHMLRCKHGLSGGRRVELLARGEVLTPDLMLLDVAYLHCWRRVGPLQLFYRIISTPVKRPLQQDAVSETVPQSVRLSSSSMSTLSSFSAAVAAPAARHSSDRGVPIVPNGDPASAAAAAVFSCGGHVKLESKVDVDVAATAPATPPVVTTTAELPSAAVTSTPAPPVRTSSVTTLPVLTSAAPVPRPVSLAKASAASTATTAGGKSALVMTTTASTTAVAATTATATSSSSSGTSSSGVGAAPHKEVHLHISETGEMSFGGGTGAAAAAHVDILQQACKILDSLETDEPPPPPPTTASNGQTASLQSRLKTPIKDSNKNEIIVPLSAPAEVKPKLAARAPDDTGQRRSPSVKESRARHGRLHDDTRKRSSPVGYKTLKTPPKSWNPQLPRSYVSAGQKTSTSSASGADGVRTMSPIAPKPPRFFKMRHTASVAAAAVSGASATDVARTPLLMRVDPAGLGAVWPGGTDQLLPTGPLIYPHLYATQPLPFLPAAGMFAPPPAHSGVSQLTYTSAPAAFSPLLAPPPPQQHHAALTLKSTSTSSSQKMALSSRPASSSSIPASAGKQRPHVVCSVPTSRPRSLSASPALTRLPLSAFMASSPMGLSSPGTAPRLNGHPVASTGLLYRPSPDPLSPRSKRPRSEPMCSASPLLAPVSLKATASINAPSQRGSESRPSPRPGAPPPPAAKPPATPSALQPETKAGMPS